MSFRKPLVRYDSSSRAQLILSEPQKTAFLPITSLSANEDSVNERKLAVPGSKFPQISPQKTNDYKPTAVQAEKRLASGAKSKKQTYRSTKKLTVVRGRVLLKIPGYPETQRIYLSKLVHHLPLKQLQQAAKRVLLDSKERRGSPIAARRRKKKKPSGGPKSSSRKVATTLFDYG